LPIEKVIRDVKLDADSKATVYDEQLGAAEAVYRLFFYHLTNSF